MNFSEIKSELGISKLQLNKSNKWDDADDTSQWFSSLIDNKVVSVHNDTATLIIKDDGSLDTLGLKSMGMKESAKGFQYELLILVKYKDVDYDLTLS